MSSIERRTCVDGDRVADALAAAAARADLGVDADDLAVAVDAAGRPSCPG